MTVGVQKILTGLRAGLTDYKSQPPSSQAVLWLISVEMRERDGREQRREIDDRETDREAEIESEREREG